MLSSIQFVSPATLAFLVSTKITGRWTPACLRAATASVETVSPPLTTLFYHSWQPAHLFGPAEGAKLRVRVVGMSYGGACRASLTLWIAGQAVATRKQNRRCWETPW
jgi:hypothetical protein